ncbi:mdj1 protein precursor [Malassezia equina]|uniref:DnaJ homolog 1, mitochondrial n=1 Tax=Malassezia equina TaxID=1381935 RepID=A0AAF0IXC0_9BASI|nr:mdj1 protein precursor [Malassezia equina]
MAEAVFAHKVREHGLEERFGVIDSCGTADYHEGEEPDMRTVRVCKSHHVPIQHLARAIQPDDFHKFDYIFGMDSNNMKNLQRIQPKGSKAQVHLFSSFDDGATVMDPYYIGDKAFHTVFEHPGSIYQASCTMAGSQFGQRCVGVLSTTGRWMRSSVPRVALPVPSLPRTFTSVSHAPRGRRPTSWNSDVPATINKLRGFHTSAANLAAQKDPYATLGVKRDATAKDIKNAYYQLAKKYHPDTSKEPGAKERFVEIQSAYDILSDEQKRASYDQFGSADGPGGFDPFGGAGGASPFGGFNPGSAESIFESLFGGTFGGARGARAGFTAETRGEDIDASVHISFEEACKGTTRTVTIHPIENCGTCSGSGLKANAKRTTCHVCRGTGTRTFVIQGGFQMASTCPACNGTGSSIAPGDECPSCLGAGRVKSTRTITVNIPAGVDDGYRIRQDGAGDVPLMGSGPAGSLFVRIHVTPSRIWRRQGTNLFYPAPIPFYTAVLGGRVRVPTLDGEVDVRVPAGTQAGDEMILRGRGVPRLGSRKNYDMNGDLMVQFDITIPRSLSKRQKELLQQFADEYEGKVNSPPSEKSTPSSDTKPSHKDTETPKGNDGKS